MTPHDCALLKFHLSGERPDGAESDPATLGLCPALLRGYLDLTAIRHDYPLILIDSDGGPPIESLSEIVGEILRSVAPLGVEGERTRRNILALERTIRGLVAGQDLIPVSKAFDDAAEQLLANGSPEEREPVLKNLVKARGALSVEGRIQRCGPDASFRVVAHLFDRVENGRRRKTSTRIREMMARLRALLRNDDLRSRKGRAPAALREAIAGGFRDEIDFSVMTETLPDSDPESLLSPRRRRRIEWAIETLDSERFFQIDRRDAYEFQFSQCRDALDAYQARLAEMIELAKAIRVAELEMENLYSEALHDSLLSKLDQKSLDPRDASMFPSYLVCMDGDLDEADERSAVLGVLSSQLPVKLVFRTTEVFHRPSLADDGDFTTWHQGLGRMATGLGNAFVMQAPCSHLYAMRRNLRDGVEYHGPALFCIASGGAANTSAMPAYLLAASALYSRAFPAFVYDPDGDGDPSRLFRVGMNPQADRTWPVGELAYQNSDQQIVREEMPFTLVDHLAADRSFSGYFMSVPKSDWTSSMIPLRDYWSSSDAARENAVPYILMSTDDGVLRRVVVQRALVEAAERCSRDWQLLQALGGIETSRVQTLLERAKREWEREHAADTAAQSDDRAGSSPAASPPDTSSGASAGSAEPAGTGPAAGQPYIETARCSTCDECINRNNKMFRYDENKRAYIADLQAGTYRQMVEAAEACKLALIHPGEPWNPDEPDLEDLKRRAAAFV